MSVQQYKIVVNTTSFPFIANSWLTKTSDLNVYQNRQIISHSDQSEHALFFD